MMRPHTQSRIGGCLLIDGWEKRKAGESQARRRWHVAGDRRWDSVVVEWINRAQNQKQALPYAIRLASPSACASLLCVRDRAYACLILRPRPATLHKPSSRPTSLCLDECAFVKEGFPRTLQRACFFSAASMATTTAASPAMGSVQNLSPVNGAPARVRGPPASAFFGANLKKGPTSSAVAANNSPKPLVVRAEEDENKQSKRDRWAGLAYDTSDDQQDITRGKGFVDSLFQGAVGMGTQHAVMSSYEYISQGQRMFALDNTKDGFYIAPAFMDKLVVHIAKNFMNLPNIKVPLILGIWGGKGQGKSFQCELVFSKLGINPIMMSAGELESGNAGEPAKLIRQRYREAADIIQKKGKMCCLFINDLDAGAGRMGGTTQYTVNNQMVNATLMNIADSPTNVQLPGVYIKEEIPRVPIIVTGNDFSTLYAPLIRDGRMEKFYWAPTREDRIGVCKGIFRTDNVPDEDVVKLVDQFPGQSIDFFGALRARVYDDEVRKWIADIGVDQMGKKLVNSREGPPSFEKPHMSITTLLEYGMMLVKEQENVKRVQLADKYMKEAALGDANEDAIKQGTF